LSGLPLPFYDNRLLFGHAARPGLLAFEAGEDTVKIWSREGDETRVLEEPFRPFLLLGTRIS